MNAQLKESPRKELLIGAGAKREKAVTWPGIPGEFGPILKEWDGLVTLDISPKHHPDVVHDLDVLPYPFADNEFDEIHAYEVLEHCGTQGDWRFFFAQFSEFHRIMKPGAFLVGSCPSWDHMWAWSDPGHRRIISHGSLNFLQQRFYDQVGGTSCTDYRDFYKADFKIIDLKEQRGQFFFALQSIK